MIHPETWHILPEESNWEEGDPYAIYLENEDRQICVLFVIPIVYNVFFEDEDYAGFASEVFDSESAIYELIRVIYDDVINDDNTAGLVGSAFTYYLVHELIHWGLSE